jgi:FKBP-type peptidyl-prolyl cis-trans isomerase FklB
LNKYQTFCLIFLIALFFRNTQPCTAETSPETFQEKASYSLGYEMGRQFKKDGARVDLEMFRLGAKHALEGKKPLLSTREHEAVLKEYSSKLAKHRANKRREQAAGNLQKSRNYLAGTAGKEGVKETQSGLLYKVLRKGNGARISLSDKVKVSYEGRLIDGTVFDSSYARGKPVVIPVSKVIKGWQEALLLMPVGSKYRLFIPPHLAYGQRGVGEKIGPNEALVFDLELLSVNKE